MTRKFETGANRNSSDGKFQYSKFINPLNEYSFAKYMHEKRELADGTMREGDNWQKGIPKESLFDSLTRHIKELELLDMGLFVYHVTNDSGEHTYWSYTEVLELSDCAVNKIDILNAIRFNSEAYKLQELGYKKESDES